jgi:hypothetical protein
MVFTMANRIFFNHGSTHHGKSISNFTMVAPTMVNLFQKFTMVAPIMVSQKVGKLPVAIPI